MKVQRSEESAEPGYPERQEYLRKRQVLGAAVLGAGLALGACSPPPPRTAGVPVQPHRLGGVSPPPHPPATYGPYRTPGVPPPPR